MITSNLSESAPHEPQTTVDCLDTAEKQVVKEADLDQRDHSRLDPGDRGPQRLRDEREDPQERQRALRHTHVPSPQVRIKRLAELPLRHIPSLNPDDIDRVTLSRDPRDDILRQ